MAKSSKEACDDGHTLRQLGINHRHGEFTEWL